MKMSSNEKIAARLEKFRAAYIEMVQDIQAGKEMHVSISAGNIKMGSVPSVSTLPIMTCPALCRETCAADCYAAKIAALRPSVLKAYAKNTALAILRPVQYWTEVRDAIAGSRFFRYHVSDEILNKAYFAEMVRSAVDYPHCDILAFTKRFDVVNAWIRDNGPLPQNLHILFSGWENMTPDNPHGLPETAVVDADVSLARWDLPDGWKPCGGNCHDCATGCRGCFAAQTGDVIVFKKH